jgi:hypothetical protein
LLEGCFLIESASMVDILFMVDWDWFGLIILFVYIIYYKFLFLFTPIDCFYMMHKSIELLPNKPKFKDTLWNLSELLGHNIIATP